MGWIWARCGVILEVPEAPFGGFEGVFGAPGAPFGRPEANLDTCTSKRGAAEFLPSTFGQKKWARELAGRCPGDRKIGRRRPEERTKRLCEEKIVKTSKTSTLSTNKLFFRARERTKIVEFWSQSVLHSVISSMVS